MEYWAEENEIELEDDEGLKYTTLDVLKFQEDFKIPFAGYRNSSAMVFAVGESVDLWSSSPYVGHDGARYLYLGPRGANASYDNSRVLAHSLRCFKDSYLSFPSSEDVDSTVTVYIET